jgi:hypothetical protein
MNDDDLRNGYAELLGKRPQSRAGCPSTGRLRALVERTGPESDRLVTLDHVMSCAGCRTEFDLVRAVAESKPAAPVRRVMVPLAAAAGLGFLLVGGLLWRAVLTRPEEAVRGETGQVELLVPSGSQNGAAIRFMWRSAGAGARYALEVFTPSGNPVYAASVTDTIVTLPDSIALTPGSTYHWWLVVRATDGTERKSGVATFIP